MNGWRECIIDDVFDVARGGSPRPIGKYITDDPEGINWIMIGDTSDRSKYITRANKKILRSGLKKTRMVYPGDFLLTNSMSFGRPYINQIEGCIHDGWLVLRPRERECIHPDFFYHLLGSPDFKHTFEKQAAGAVVKNLNTSIVKSLQIRLPKKIEEQRRIAAILDKADTIRHKREQTLFLAHDLLKSVFLEMFGSPLTNSKQFPTIALGDLIKVSSGNGLTAKDMDPAGIYPVYGSNGVKGFHSEYMFDDPQLVIGRVGSCGEIHLTRPKSWVTDNALYIREYKRPVNLTYLEWALRFADLNQYANQAAQPLISGSRIYPIEILFPSELEQDTFAAYVERQKRLLNNLEASRKEANDLFASLSQCAFRGDL